MPFFDGALLDPAPPEPSKSGHVRYFHIHEGEGIDEAQLISWVKQAAKRPGQKM